MFLFPFLKQRWSLFLLTRSGSQESDLLWDRDGKQRSLGLGLWDRDGKQRFLSLGLWNREGKERFLGLELWDKVGNRSFWVRGFGVCISFSQT